MGRQERRENYESNNVYYKLKIVKLSTSSLTKLFLVYGFAINQKLSIQLKMNDHFYFHFVKVKIDIKDSPYNQPERIAMQDFEITDAIYRSRDTVLDMMDERGYNVSAYRNFSPTEITYMMISPEGQALRMDFTHKDNKQKCVVHYCLSKIKAKLKTYLEVMNDPEKPEYLDPETTEVILLVTEPVVDTFHQAVLNNYGTHKSRVFIFQIQTLVNNPSKHYMVPKHEKVPAEEHIELMKSLYLKSKTQFPLIRYHADMQARYLGLVPGDIVRITRPSPSAGEYILYRVCST